MTANRELFELIEQNPFIRKNVALNCLAGDDPELRDSVRVAWEQLADNGDIEVIVGLKGEHAARVQREAKGAHLPEDDKRLTERLIELGEALR